MALDRVDKEWHRKGIETYSVESMLGTLAHYGVAMTAEAFLELTKHDFPLAIAQRWHEQWKGTGQFSRFPAAAAEELWRRLNSTQIAPTDVSLAIVNLLTVLNDALNQKADDGTWDTRFKVVEAYLPRIPEEGERREPFMAEMAAALGEWIEVFDAMGEALAKKNQPAYADRFAVLEEALFPERKGTATALVKAAKGDVDGAVVDLKAIASDTTRNASVRLSAIDGLFFQEQFDEAKRFTFDLVDLAAQGRDVELASQVVERLSRLLKLDPKREDKAELRARVAQLASVFES